MNRPADGKLTPKNQLQPAPARDQFLQGVLEEAAEQGYSVKDQGRLFVVGLRTWEKR